MAKLSPNGREVLWATFLGGGEDDSAAALTVDARGNVYIGGETSSPDFPATASATPSAGTAAAGTAAAFAAKLDTSGRLVYATVFPAGSVTGLALDSQGGAWLAGSAVAGFSVTAGAFDTQYAGVSGDGYLEKIGPSGKPLYGSYMGTGDSPLAVAVNADDEPLVAGAGGFFGHPAPKQPADSL